MASSPRAAASLRIEVVDSTCERGAAGMRVDVFALGAGARKLCGGVVDVSGIVEVPVLATEAIVPGEYEVVFHVGDYFRGRDAADGNLLLDTVPFRFAMPPAQRYVLPVRVGPRSFALVPVPEAEPAPKAGRAA